MQKVAKLVCGVGLFLIACAVSNVVPLAASGIQRNEPPQELPPSPFEAFATRPTAKVAWSKMIGQLESQEARATVTALIVEDTANQPSVMRGLLIELAHIGKAPSCDQKLPAWRIMCRRANAAVYIEEERLEAVRNGIMRGAAELRPREFISQYSTTAPGQASGGLIVCGYQFSYRQPSELAALFTRAITELKEATR